MDPRISQLESELNDFAPEKRAAALSGLLSMMRGGEIEPAPVRDVVNMHCHSFYSFNAYGYSPTALAWLAKKQGFRVIGIVDFDVLDGVDEFLNACDQVQVRASAGIETRTFLAQFSSRETNSPGEPGVYYHMGIGFATGKVPDTARDNLHDLRIKAGQRNRDVMDRVNAYLDPVKIDYERDVLPLSPGGTPTERHMVVAYLQAAERTVPDAASFWADKLQAAPEKIADLLENDSPQLQNMIRSRLMKRGGVGYVQPSADAFPITEDVSALIRACGALPCAAWLDGTSRGEQDIDELLDLLMDQGAVTLNIVPDRNWNISDPEMRKLKVGKLYEIVKKAQERYLPLNVGTEMNSFGQKLVDDFESTEMAPLRQAFLDGAHFIYGHTLLHRALGLGFESEWAKEHLPARPDRNDFYTRLGYAVPPSVASLDRLRQIDAVSPDAVLEQINRKGAI